MDINKFILGSSPFIDSPMFAKESRKRHNELNDNDIAEIINTSFKKGFKYWHYVADERLLKIAQNIKDSNCDIILIQTIGYSDFKQEMDAFRLISPQYIFLHKRIVDSNNVKLVNDIIQFFHQKNMQIILHSSNPIQIIKLNIDYSEIAAFAFPINALGLGLDLNSGNLYKHLTAIKQIKERCKIDVFALSPLASGRLPISYLNYSHTIADKCFIGISSLQQLKEIVLSCAKMNTFKLTEDIKYTIPQNIKLNLKSVYIELTNKCNFQCKHCYVKQNPTEIDYEQLRKFLLFFVESGGKSIKLSGGEPLLYMHLADILFLCHQYKVEVTICTNGSLLNSNIINEYTQQGIKFQVSIESHIKNEFEKIRGKNSFETVFNNLYLLKQIVPERWSCMITILPDNYEALDAIVSEIITYLPAKIGFSIYDSKGRPDMLYKEFEYNVLKKIKQKIETLVAQYGNVISNPFASINNMAKLPDAIPKCLIFCGQMKIASNGDIYPCVLLNDFKYSIGNIKENLTILDKTSQTRKVYTHIWNRLNHLEDCKNCVWKYKCQAGCLGKSPDYFKVDKFCSLRLSEFPDIIKIKI